MINITNSGEKNPELLKYDQFQKKKSSFLLLFIYFFYLRK